MNAWVLIVDDEEMIRENLKAYLEDEGWRVAAFEAVAPALRWLREGTLCQICIMDMRLPDMDGNSAIRTLHRLYPDMAFLIHTGSSSYSLPEDLRAITLASSKAFGIPLAGQIDYSRTCLPGWIIGNLRLASRLSASWPWLAWRSGSGVSEWR